MRRLQNESGIAFIGLLLAVAVMIALFFAATITTVSRTQQARAVIRRQVYSQEIFQNAAVMIHDAYLRKANAAACPAPTVLRTIRGTDFCFHIPDPDDADGDGISGCIKNPEANQETNQNPICLTTSSGEVVMAPAYDENVYAAWILDNVLERRWPSLNPLAVDEAVAQSAYRNVLPVLCDPAADPNCRHNPPNAPVLNLANNPRTLCTGEALNVGANPGYLCVSVKICMRKSLCQESEKMVQGIGFPTL